MNSQWSIFKSLLFLQRDMELIDGTATFTTKGKSFHVKNTKQRFPRGTQDLGAP